MQQLIVALAVAALAVVPRLSLGADTGLIAAEITVEATLSNGDPARRPLPLLSHWTTGIHPLAKGWTPGEQLKWIEQGHYVLPWFQLPGSDDLPSGYARGDLDFRAYYESAFARARELKLPVVLIDSQWERFLTQDPYFKLPPEKNPNVVAADGKVQHMVSPFGPVDAWRELGRRLTDNRHMRTLQSWYPDPPLVVFLSNNEGARLNWTDAEKSSRYVQKYGKGRDDDFKRKVVAEGWIERYRALQSGMRDGLTETWKAHAIFVGYDAFGPRHFGRWYGWKGYSLYVPGRIDPSPLMWDGGSPSFYTDNWNQSTDYKAFSPQIEAMNWVFMQSEAYRLNPAFWLELSVWDGHMTGAKSKRADYARLGQTYTPARYEGMAQFGMWLIRPRVVREFRDYMYPWSEGEAYFRALMDAVDRVHTNAVLREWWRSGALIPNHAHRHPYQTLIPPEYAEADRWFLLDAEVNRPFPWDLTTEVQVFALALVKGTAPAREWLIYAHSPLGDRRNVRLTVPGYGTVGVDVAVAGSFYVVHERMRTVDPVAGA